MIYAYHPPLTTGISAALIKFFRRIPVVYDIQDLWPDTLRATGMFSNELALKLVGCVCDGSTIGLTILWFCLLVLGVYYRSWCSCREY